MSSPLSAEQETWDPRLGPKPLPRWHGKGCICGNYPREDCPVKDTPENVLKRAQGRVRRAAERLNNAHAELQAAVREHEEAHREAVAAAVALEKRS